MADYPRALTEREREILSTLLPKKAFPNAEIYRRQIDRATVAVPCFCGCATVTLEIDRAKTPRARFRGSPLLPVELESLDRGPNATRVTLSAPMGWLQDLEIHYTTKQPPAEFPPPDAYRLITKPAKPGP